MFLPDHPVFPEGLQESEDFASSAQSTAELIKKENYVSKKCIFWTNLERKNCALKKRKLDKQELQMQKNCLKLCQVSLLPKHVSDL